MNTPARRNMGQTKATSLGQIRVTESRTFLSFDDDVIQLHATDRMLTRIDRERDTLPGITRQKIADQCQKIAESIRTDRHRATWVYNRAIAAQRTAVLAHRAEIMDGSVVDGRVRDLIAEHWQRLVDARGRASVSETTQAVALFFLDEQWVSHLTVLQEIRDGIHLRALGGEKPADEFHRLALREFHGFFDRTYQETADFIARLNPDDIGRDLTELGLRRPSATWTYMVTDDPYGNPGDRFIRRVGKFVRSKILNLE